MCYMLHPTELDSGGTKRATSVNVLLLCLRSPDGNFRMSRRIRSVQVCLAGAEVACSWKSHVWCTLGLLLALAVQHLGEDLVGWRPWPPAHSHSRVVIRDAKP